jgi:hypothetical protein
MSLALRMPSEEYARSKKVFQIEHAEELHAVP